MAVNIDSVYQKVLALANKEQRGYITPQEFNLFADQAQMEIFEQYFYDTNQFKRIPGNDSEYHDMVDLIDEKLYFFKKSEEAYQGMPLSHENISDMYRLGDVYALEPGYSPANADPLSKSVIIEEIKQEDLIKTQNSPLTRATNSRPVYYIQNNKIYFVPESQDTIFSGQTGGQFRIYYISKPIKPNWGYVVMGDKALYNANTSVHFELHPSEESELVYKILLFAGITLEKPQLTQVAATLENAKVQQEKQ